MTNPDNVGGLLPCPGCGKSDLDHCPADFVAVNGLTRGMIVRCAWCHFAAPEAAWNRRELCRAAPAGGVRVDGEMFICYLIDKCERETISEESLHQWLADFLKNPRYHKPVSAPAGSGEVGLRHWSVELMTDLIDYAESGKVAEPSWIPRMQSLLRKLQQGADYETPSIECYSYDGDQWFDAPDDVELVAGRRAGDTFELMVSHYSIQRKYVVKKAPDCFGDDYEVEPVRAASQGQEGGTNG